MCGASRHFVLRRRLAKCRTKRSWQFSSTYVVDSNLGFQSFKSLNCNISHFTLIFQLYIIFYFSVVFFTIYHLSYVIITNLIIYLNICISLYLVYFILYLAWHISPLNISIYLFQFLCTYFIKQTDLMPATYLRYHPILSVTRAIKILQCKVQLY